MNKITGFIDYYNKCNNHMNILENMIGRHALEISDDSKAITYSDNMIILRFKGEEYKIVLSGEIYNKEKVKKILKENNVELETNLDEEKIVKLYAIYKEECLEYLKGVFSFLIFEKNSEKAFAARDPFGVKSLFYTIKDDIYVFSSDIKDLFKYPGVNPILDKNSISELFGLSPARKLGSGVFKNIQEVKPGHFIIYSKEGIIDNAYFRIEAKEHTDDINQTVEKVHDLVKKSTIEQIEDKREISTFLSGGIDSSLLTAIVAKEARKQNRTIQTFSVDYVDNDKNFKANEFQPARDNYYIELVSKKYNTKHEYILLDTNDLIDNLEKAVMARGLPSMADIDSSLYAFCKKVRNSADTVLSGEFADEIFGGYPWFYREDALDSNTFPWSIAIKERQELMKKEFTDRVNIKEYIDILYNDELENVPVLDCFTEEEKKIRKLQYMTLYYFGETLIDRTDRMAGIANLNVRVPFVNKDIVQYVYNIPWNIKNYNNMEKGILREAFKEYIPEEIKNRKKSPYPKTYNPNYLNSVKNILNQIIEDKNSPIHNIINIEFVKEIIKTDGKSFKRPWFGQLMTGPQLMAYLIQLNIWLEKFNPEIII